uniref:Glutathione peroxidase n=1 Tax=Anopheles dirus TaxID=7168 RepID=A0A182NCZ1_9DIPT
TFLVGLALAEKKNATEQSVEVPAGAKEKRQTEHETRSIPLSLIANRRQQALHHHQQQQQSQQEYYQSDEAAGPFYAAQPSAGQPTAAAAAHKAGASQEQPQYQELPPEYISLLHQLAEHQPKASALKQGKAVNQQYEPQSHGQHPKPSQVQYITEEEYAQLLKQAQQQPGPVAPQHHPHHHQQPQPQHHQPQGLQAYGRPSSHVPAGAHKYRPSIQLLETGEEQPGAYGQQAADGEQYRIQYKSIQQAGTVTPVPKPVSSFSFENELAKLVESNRPLAYHQVPHPHHHPHHHPGRHEVPQHDAGQRYAGPTPSPQSHEYTYVQAGAPARDHVAPPPKQSIKAQYIAPFAQGLPLTGPKISPAHLQVGPQKFVDSPAQKYQFIAQPESAPSKAHHYQQQQPQPHHHHQAPAHQGQQYLTEVSPKQHPGAPSPKIQYYIPKEKNVQIYYQQAQQQQAAIEQHSPQHPMKIVEAPQLQNEKPQKTVHSHQRSKATEQQQQQQQQQVHQQHRYAPREKQQDASDSHAPSRSAIYVSQSTGVTQATAAATPAPAAHGHKIPPKIDRPLTQEEFQALVDAGYSVVPVPVPVPVPISQYQQHQQQQQQAAAHHAGHPGAPHPGARAGPPHPTPAAIGRQAAQASRYHLHQLATAENNQNQVVTYLRPLHLDPFSAGSTESDATMEDYKNAKSVYDFTVKDSQGADVSLEKYRGKVLLVVNIASQCGLTKGNYAELTELSQKYADKDFKILSFPCNQFGGQMPEGDGEEMVCHLRSAKAEVGDVFAKIDVNGDGAHPLYKYLKHKQGGTLGDSIKWNFAKFLIKVNGDDAEPLYKYLKHKQGGILGDSIKWNFSKFLVNKDGQPVDRYAPTTSPKSIVKDIDKLLEASSGSFCTMQSAPEKAKSIFEFTAADLNANEVSLDRYQGTVCLIVNFSTKDAAFEKVLGLLTPLVRKYHTDTRKDLNVLFFPCFQFGAKESPEEIAQRFESSTGTVPIGEIFSEIEVNGSKAPGLYKYLKAKKPGNCGGFVNSNFTIFLTDRQGVPVERLNAGIHPYTLEDMVENLLR